MSSRNNSLNPPPYNITKNWHQNNYHLRDIASHPTITKFIKPILGSKVILWGSEVIYQHSKERHAWHIDVELADRRPGLTVWIALKNMELSELHLISKSHRIPFSPQESVSKLPEKERMKWRLNSTFIEETAKKYDTETTKHKLVVTSAKVGEMIIWKGRVWHYTENNSNRSRTSVILQFVQDTGNLTHDLPLVPVWYMYPRTPWFPPQVRSFYPFHMTI